MERKEFIETLKEGERYAEGMNKRAGIEVAVGMLSVNPGAIEVAYYMKLASEGGPVKDFLFMPFEALPIANMFDSNQLRIIAEIRGIELAFDE